MILALLLAASTLLTGACRDNKSGSETRGRSSPKPLPRQPELRAEDFDPKPDTPPALKISGERAYQNLKDFVALGPRYLGSDGHAKAEQFILSHLEGAQIEQDKFTVDTAAAALR